MTGYSGQQEQHVCPFCEDFEHTEKSRVKEHAIATCPDVDGTPDLAEIERKLEAVDADELADADVDQDDVDEEPEMEVEQLDATPRDGEDLKCPYCGKQFDTRKGVGGHKGWCDERPEGVGHKRNGDEEHDVDEDLNEDEPEGEYRAGGLPHEREQLDQDDEDVDDASGVPPAPRPIEGPDPEADDVDEVESPDLEAEGSPMAGGYLETRELELVADLAADRLGSYGDEEAAAWLWVRARQLLRRGPP